jgi:hypothetical protein
MEWQSDVFFNDILFTYNMEQIAHLLSCKCKCKYVDRKTAGQVYDQGETPSPQAS